MRQAPIPAFSSRNAKIDLLELLDIIDVRLLNAERAQDEGTIFEDGLHVACAYVAKLCASQAWREIGLEHIQSLLDAMVDATLWHEQSDFDLHKLTQTFSAAIDYLRDEILASGSGSVKQNDILAAFEQLNCNARAGSPKERPSLEAHQAAVSRVLMVKDPARPNTPVETIFAHPSFEVTEVDSVGEGIARASGETFDSIVFLGRGDSKHALLLANALQALGDTVQPALKRRLIILDDSLTFTHLKQLLELSVVYAVHRESGDPSQVSGSVFGALSYKGKLMSQGVDI